jgi:signal transduction histidine kinase
MGIQPEDQQWVYEPFFRSESAMGVKGHGIGLSLVMNIVKIHHASLNLHSEPKKGSTFEIVFDVK